MGDVEATVSQWARACWGPTRASVFGLCRRVAYFSMLLWSLAVAQALAAEPPHGPLYGYQTNPANDPDLLSRFGVSKVATWMEVTQSEGSTLRKSISQAGFAEHLITVLQDNGALAPAWQVATVQCHWAQAQASHHPIDHALTAGKGVHAYAGNQAYSLQGNAAETADFKTQDFGVLVVHIAPHLAQNPGVQASAQALNQTLEHIHQQALQRSETLRDVENDGYAERTDWISATDGAGNLQGLLVLDHDSNGLIETRDILNLGGNAGQAGNPTTEAALATQNAALQRNNVQWLDANGDGVLDARDPAFAAVKLWVSPRTLPSWATNSANTLVWRQAA